MFGIYNVFPSVQYQCLMSGMDKPPHQKVCQTLSHINHILVSFYLSSLAFLSSLKEQNQNQKLWPQNRGTRHTYQDLVVPKDVKSRYLWSLCVQVTSPYTWGLATLKFVDFSIPNGATLGQKRKINTLPHELKFRPYYCLFHTYVLLCMGVHIGHCCYGDW